MNVLAIDSTGHYSSVGIFEIIESKVTLKFKNSNFTRENKNCSISDLINSIAYKYKIKKLNLIAISTGPGSFTKIRSSMSYAKGLSMGLGIPIVGINSINKLFSLCRDVKGKEEGLLVTCDTFRNLVFASIYKDKKKLNIYEDVKILSISEVKNIEGIEVFKKLIVVGDASYSVIEDLLNNGFKISNKFNNYISYGEHGLKSLVKLAIEIKGKNNNFDQQPDYLTEPITNLSKTRGKSNFGY